LFTSGGRADGSVAAIPVGRNYLTFCEDSPARTLSNLATNVAETARSRADDAAINYESTEVSYEAFWARTGQFAAALDERGVGTGGRVATYLPNLPQFLAAFHGTLRAGGGVVPMNPKYRSREIGHLLSDSEASVVVALADLVPFVEEVRDDTAVEHDAVAEAAVVGVPNERRGETVKAYVVPASTASGGSSDEQSESDGVTTPDADVTEDEIREYCLSNLAEYKHPREVEFVDELPRTTTGKVQQFKLREQEEEADD